MTPVPSRYAALHALLGRNRLEAEVVEELEHHFDSLVERYLGEGMTEREAKAAALERFGDMARIREETTFVDRQVRRRTEVLETLHDVWRALRLAGRRLARRPDFTVFALATLSLAFGAFAALFTVLDRLVLSPLPFAEADRLVWIESAVPSVGDGSTWGLSQAGYFDFRDHVPALASLGAFSTGSGNLVADGEPSRVRVAVATTSLLEALRLTAAAGRTFATGEDAPGGPAVALLDHAFWSSRFGGDASVVGSTIDLDGNAYEVVGVLDRGQGLPDIDADIWLPLRLDPSARPVNAHWLSVIGRLVDDADIATARAELQRRTAGFVEAFPSAYSETFMRDTGFRTVAMPVKDHVLGSTAGTVWVLFSAAGLLLLIALANITNLYLVRSEGRRRDFAVRAALGAGRRHLTWQSLSETLLLSVVAGAIAVGVARVGVGLVVGLAPTTLPRLSELGVGSGTITFTLAVSLVAGLLLGLIPVAIDIGGGESLVREGSARSTASPGRHRVRRVMLGAQMALALVLLASGGLLMRSLAHLRGTDPGFDASGVLAFDTFVPWSRYGTYDEVYAFYREFLDRIESIPGVERAGATTQLPMVDAGGCAALFVEDQPPQEDRNPPCLPTALATPGFFETLRIPVSGEPPRWGSMEAGDGAVVVTRALADRFWPGDDAIDRGIRGNGWAQPFYRVRGVAADFRSEGLDHPPLQGVFFPMKPIEGAPLWSPPNAMRVVVRTAGDPMSVVPAIRAALREMDPTVPLANPRDYDDAILRTPAVSRTRFSFVLLGIAGALALLLSTLGMYGVVAQLVTERSSEIAVRLALGARLRGVVQMILGQSMRVAIVGAVVGLVATVAVSRTLRAALYDVAPTDPKTLIAATTVLLATVALATGLAARRAGRVDPARTLRSD